MRSLTKWIVKEKKKRGNRIAYSFKGNHPDTTGRKFTLTFLGLGKWNVAGTDLSGSYRRKVLPGRFDCLDDAKEEAKRILFSAGSVEAEKFLVSDLLATWLKNKVASPVTLKGYKQAIGLFLDWCENQKPGIRRWDRLSLGVLDAYVKDLVKQGKAKDTIRLYTTPLRQASKKIAKNSRGQLHNFADGFELPTGNQKFFLEDLEDGLHLPFDDAVEFAEFLAFHGNGWTILGGILVQCFAGLRVMEALRLTRERVDLDRGFLSIEGVVKGEYALRRIPLPKLVVDVLSNCPFKQDRLLYGFDGDHAYNSYNHAFQRFLGEWDKEGRYSGLTPKCLRKTLESEATLRGWEGYAFNRYMGRAPQTIQEKHYIGKGVSQAQLFQMFRTQIVSRIDEVLESIYHAKNARKNATGNIVQFPLLVSA